MENISAFVENLEPLDFLIILGGILLIVVFLILQKRNSKKILLSNLSDCETDYNSLKSIPLSFKFNKAKAISKLDEKTMEEVVQYQGLHDQIQNNLKQIATIFAETEDAIHLGKFKNVENNISDLKDMLILAKQQVSKLNIYLDKVLEKEGKQRSEITVCKDQFRTLKNTFNERESQFSFCWSAISERLDQCEKHFTSFEEWMYASEYENATAELELIQAEIDYLKQLEENIPEILKEARGVIPNMIEEVSRNYSIEKRKGIYIDHLEIPRNLELVQDILKDDLNNLKNCHIENILEHCEDYKVRLGQLQGQLDHEVQSFSELEEMIKHNKKVETVFDGLFHYFSELNLNSMIHYGIDNFVETVENTTKKVKELANLKEVEFENMSKSSVPASTILITLKDIQQQEDSLLSELVIMKEKIDKSYKDEYRAMDQLLKLQLVTNEIKIKVKKNRLPSISDQFHEDLQKAYEYTRGISNLLKETPLNTAMLNSYLSEALEFISKLHANVNNIVGVAKWVEDAIVFGNKFRSTYPDIDSELTKSELLYRNGEYSQALKIAIAAIEQLYPTSFEQKIQENARSVT